MLEVVSRETNNREKIFLIEGIAQPEKNRCK
jgi:hypothetical protein